MIILTIYYRITTWKTVNWNFIKNLWLSKFTHLKIRNDIPQCRHLCRVICFHFAGNSWQTWLLTRDRLDHESFELQAFLILEKMLYNTSHLRLPSYSFAANSTLWSYTIVIHSFKCGSFIKSQGPDNVIQTNNLKYWRWWVFEKDTAKICHFHLDNL